MHARPEFHEVLISTKMRRWLRIAKYPHMIHGVHQHERGVITGGCARHTRK